MISYITVLWIVIAISVYLIKSIIKPRKFPPGPRWYPIVGCTDIVERMTKKHGSQWKGFSALAKQYSTDVLGLKLANELLVVVYGDKHIRHVFTEKEFDGRPQGFFFMMRCFGKKSGITFADGSIWREQRHFAVKQLRNNGFGKPIMENKINKEINKILVYLQANENKPIPTKRLLSTSITNIVWEYIAGESINEERLHLLLELMNARSKAFSIAGGLLNQMPWLRFIIPTWSGYSLIVKINQQVTDLIQETIMKHLNLEVDGEDFMYSFLEEVRNNKDNFSLHQLTTICMDLIIAGSQTSSNVLEFAIVALLRNSHVQEKVYQEINRVLGDEPATWNDTHRLPYTCAFILEVQRFYTIVPLAGPRRVLKDTYIGEYFVPKNTTVLIATGDLHMDPEIWDDPNEFKPERFINENGTIKNPEYLYPFSLGRRRCPGEPLAKVFIFLVLVNIIQKFKLNCSDGIPPSGEPMVRMFAAPYPFTANFVSRKSCENVQ